MPASNRLAQDKPLKGKPAMGNTGDKAGPQPTATGETTAQFAPVPFDRVRGGTKGGTSQHAGSPDGSGGPIIGPGPSALTDIAATGWAARGNAAVRSKAKPPRPQSERPGRGD
jgi:hypothetical protein